MPKKQLDIDVLTAAKQRVSTVFDYFQKIVVSFSAGKDSSVMLHLVASEARKRGRRFTLLLIDLEAQYKATIDHAMVAFAENADVCDPMWVSLPLALRNATSVFQPKWLAWDPCAKNIWVRQPPPFAITDESFFPFFRRGMEFEEFVDEFAKWHSNGDLTCCMVGIRADESLNRYRAIVMDNKSRFKNIKWTTYKGGTTYNAYPIYDWKTEDDWTYVAKTGMHYNTLYDLMHLNGMSIHEMRICQPYGDDQRKGLDQFHALEPETWERVLRRVKGANYGALYAHTSGNILGNIKIKRPDGLSWEQYADMLLQSLPDEYRTHFENKIAVFLNWYLDRGYPNGIPDEADVKLEAAKKVPSWRRIVKAILKNDYWCKSLSFSMHKSTGYENYKRVMKGRRAKWGF